MWNRCGTWNLHGTSEVWNLGELELYVEALWALEPLNIGEPELLRLEPLCGTLGNLVPGLGRLPQTTPKLYWKNPKLFKLLGKIEPSFFKGHSAPEISTIADFFSLLGCHRQFGGTFIWNLVEPQLVRMEPLCGTWWNLNF